MHKFGTLQYKKPFWEKRYRSKKKKKREKKINYLKY